MKDKLKNLKAIKKKPKLKNDQEMRSPTNLKKTTTGKKIKSTLEKDIYPFTEIKNSKL